MDLTLLERKENNGVCYKLFKANFHYDYYVILAQTKNEFYCGSFSATLDEAKRTLYELSDSETEVFCVADIIADLQKQSLL